MQSIAAAPAKEIAGDVSVMVILCKLIAILITILTCYICMFECGSFRGNPSCIVAWGLNCTTWQILRGYFSFSFSLHPWLGEESLNSNNAPSSPKVRKHMQCMCNSTHQIKLWVEVCDCTAVKMSSTKWIILIRPLQSNFLFPVLGMAY